MADVQGGLAPRPPDAPPAPLLKAILMLLGAVTLFVLLDATASHLGKTYPVPMLVWARYTVHCLLMVVFLAPSMRLRLVSTARPRRQIVRALCLLATTFFGMAAFIRMPLAETTAIIFLSPLLVTVLAGPLLGERIGALRWAASIGGFIGVLLIARPGSGLSPEGVTFALGAALMYAIYQIQTRQLSATENPVTMLFYTALTGTLAMTLLLPWIWGGPLPGLVDGLLIIALGLFGGIGHFLLIRAFREAPASVLSPILYAQLVIATFVGALLFGHIPDLPALTGILIIAGAGAVIALDGQRKHAAGRHKG
ncbi:DMT family transporter [Thauera humireducens]|uniref:Permease n=1 Tax=Thauera humireducens TaxID=1134435 RepID=A0A127K3L3_9RHOO|nr:DMT family transporter [Thauera humireducens]AMO36546.1 permease [Thauera humireducens]